MKAKRYPNVKVLWVVFVVLLFCPFSPAWAAQLTFSQMNYNFDGATSYTDTEWGAVDFTFTGEDPLMYFNLAVDGDWKVQNIPVLSLQGAGSEQTMSYYFDLGILRGTNVSSLNYDYAFTSSDLDTMPGGSTSASVGDSTISMWAGFEGGLMKALESAKNLLGGRVTSTQKHGHKNFPNQQAGPLRCAPTAVSNSLLFLNDTKKLNMPPADMSIPKMEVAVGFIEGKGSPLDTWWANKKTYMETKGYPITTKKVTDISKLIAEIDAGQDVEIQESWIDQNGKRTGHTVALVGITQLENGTYSLDIADDPEQANPFNNLDKATTRIYDPATNLIGERWGNVKFEYAVVECPEPGTLMLLGLGGLALLRRRKR